MKGDDFLSERDLYKVLGVKSDASEDEIRAAFKNLAAKHHPDRNPNDPKAAQRFKRLNAAYQVLSDPTQRSVYDQLTEPTQDLDDKSSSSAPAKGKAKPEPEPRRAKKTTAREAEEESDSGPEAERSLVEDQTVTVTTWRVEFRNGAVYPIEHLHDARAHYQGRDLTSLGLGLCALIIGAIALAAQSKPVAYAGFGSGVCAFRRS